MHTDDAMSNLSYKALSNDRGEAGSFNAAVRQNLTKNSMGAATDKAVRMVHCMVYLNCFGSKVFLVRAYQARQWLTGF